MMFFINGGKGRYRVFFFPSLVVDAAIFQIDVQNISVLDFGCVAFDDRQPDVYGISKKIRANERAITMLTLSLKPKAACSR